MKAISDVGAKPQRPGRYFGETPAIQNIELAQKHLICSAFVDLSGFAFYENIDVWS
jgi:hypothetical protein